MSLPFELRDLSVHISALIRSISSKYRLSLSQSNILHSIAYGLGFLMLILPGFYLYGRLGLFPLFIMFENKGVMDSLGESWNLTEEVATKLFALTAIFMSIQLSFGFFGGIIGTDGALWFLIASTTS